MEEILQQFTLAYTREQKIESFALFVRALRPGTFSNSKYSALQLQEAIDILKQDDALRLIFAKSLYEIIESSRLVEFFTEGGVPVGNDFFTEFFARVRHKILPELVPDSFLSKALQSIFPFSSDYKWLNEIDDKIWIDFFSMLSPIVQWHSPHVQKELCTALSVLSVRVASAGLEKPIAMRLPVEVLAETFSEQAAATDAILDALRDGNFDVVDNLYQTLRIRIKECFGALERLKIQSKVHGTSVEQTFLIRRLESQLQRMEMIAAIMFAESSFSMSDLVSFFKRSIYFVTNRYAVRELIQQNFGLLSYQIAEHKSKSGEHYIATNRKEFNSFFVASCKGGIVIAIVVILKIFIHHAHAAPFWEAVLFSLNYAAGFIIIHVTHSALATKQPAMTASKIAASLDDKKGERNLFGLAVLIGQTARSQNISFIGNLLVVFPLPFVFAYFISMLTGSTLISEKEALKMLDDVNPTKSLAWLYAAFTGVFLFISGIISGYWDNRVIYAEIPERIRQHPALKRVFSAERLNTIAIYVEHNFGALIGNFALGFFLGTAAFFGNILGLPFDIRHITIAAGNYAIGILGAHHLLTWHTYVICFIGVLGIGLINFLVSFTLAFIVAIKSRGVELKNLQGLSNVLLSYFKKHPADFISPPKEERKEFL
jgi:site-specific recombinase